MNRSAWHPDVSAIRFPSLLLVLIAPALASCGSAPGPTQAPSAALATIVPVPSRTPISPSATPSQTLAGPAIGRLSPGSAVNITSIHMLDVQTGWALGADAGPDLHVLRTEDGGQTWADLTPAESAAEPGGIRSVAAHFEDVQRAWVAFNGSVPFTPPASPVVWRTEDGGATWTASAPLDVEGLVETYDPMFLTFSDLDHGWFAAGVGVGMNHQYVNLYRTADAGRTWENLIDPYGDSPIQACSKTGLLFLDDRGGWLTGDCFGVAAGVLLYRTGDGGTIWDAVTLPSPAESPGLFEDFTAACGSYDAQFFDSMQGVLGVRCTLYGQEPYATVAHVYATGDGGQT